MAAISPYAFAFVIGSAAVAGCLTGSAPPEPDEPLFDIPGLRNTLDLSNGDQHLFGGDMQRAREFDIASDPRNPDRMAVGYIDMVPGTIWLGIARSSDGGVTWDYENFCGYPTHAADAPEWPPDCPYVGAWAMGDPVLQFLPDGTLLYAFLRITPDSINVQLLRFVDDDLRPEDVVLVARSANNMVEGQHMQPSPYGTYYNDKEQLEYDEETDTLYLAWSGLWRTPRTGGINPTRSLPFVSQSTDGGLTWSTPVAVVADPMDLHTDFDAGFNMGAWPVVSRDGRLHVVWSHLGNGDLWVATSPEWGTFEPPVLINHTVQKASKIMGGQGIPSVGIDRSGGPYDGTIYISYTADYTSDQDVYVVFSRDNGTTWQEPVRVHDDPVDTGRDQFLPELVVEPNGAVSLVFFDQRDVEDVDEEFHTYLARSIDGGRTFKNVRLTDVPNAAYNMGTGRLSDETAMFENVGDYQGISYNRDGPVPLWQDLREYSTGYLLRVMAD